MPSRLMPAGQRGRVDGEDEVVLARHEREVVGLERLLADAVEPRAAPPPSRTLEALLRRGHRLEHVDGHRERAALELVRARVPPAVPRALLRCEKLLARRCRSPRRRPSPRTPRPRARGRRRSASSPSRPRARRQRHRAEHRAATARQRGGERASSDRDGVGQVHLVDVAESAPSRSTRQSPAIGMSNPGREVVPGTELAQRHVDRRDVAARQVERDCELGDVHRRAGRA